jgi:hypothetical protein
VEINEVFKKYTRHPVLAIIDVQPQDDMSIPVDAYVAVEEVKDVRAQKPQKYPMWNLTFTLQTSQFGGQEHKIISCACANKVARYTPCIP